MNIYIDSPYEIKFASKPIVVPLSLSDKIKKLIPKIQQTSDYLRKTPKRKTKLAAILEITPEEDIYVHEGWIIKMLVTTKPPVGAILDYREQENTLYIASWWRPNYNHLYHEVIHALDPKARPGNKAYIQRDPNTYFLETPGGYYKVPEEIDAIQSSIASKIIEIGEKYKQDDILAKEKGSKRKSTFNRYLNDLDKWLKAPDKAYTPDSLFEFGDSIKIWLKDPKLRKQLLNRIYWAYQQLLTEPINEINKPNELNEPKKSLIPNES